MVVCGVVEAMRPSEAFVRACDVSWRVEIRWCRVKSGVRRRSEAVRLVDPISSVGSAAVSLSWFLSCIFWLEVTSKSKSKYSRWRWRSYNRVTMYTCSCLNSVSASIQRRGILNTWHF